MIAHATPRHYKKFDLLGLIPAIRSAGFTTIHTGGDVLKGSAELRKRLGGEALIEVNPRARGSIRALQAGCRTSSTSATPKGGYELLMENLESFCGKLLAIADSQTGAGQPNAMTARGRAYLSSRPNPSL